MIRILLIVESFGTILCHVLTKLSYNENTVKNRQDYPIAVGSVRETPCCENFITCKIINAIKALTKGVLASLHTQTTESNEKTTDIQERSYYNGYGSITSPAYYPAFDSLSVLASLAFLAFLLQSFASLFDRSRSFMPSTVSTQRSAELETLEIPRRIFRATKKYNNRSGDIVPGMHGDTT